MAAKRKKSDELWPNSPADPLASADFTAELELSVEKYIELKQRIELLEEEKEKNLKKLRLLEQTIREADAKCADHLEQLVELKHLVADLETKLEQKSEQYDQAIKQLSDEKKHFLKQEEMWQVFQKDLLTTVRVSNDLRTEAEEQSETLLNENRTLSEKIAKLENELGNLRMSIAAGERTEQAARSPTADSIVFRKTKGDHKQDGSKRNANCFAELNNAIVDENGQPDSRTNERTTVAGSKLLRQQSADSVFSSASRPPADKFASSRNSSSQSLKSISSALDSQPKNGKKSQISVKTLVETIEKAGKTTPSSTSNHQQVNSSPASLILAKSPSFNSINLNSTDKATSTNKTVAVSPFDNHHFSDRPVSLNAKLQPLLENGGGKLSKFDSKYDEKLNKLPESDAHSSAKSDEKLMNKLNDRMSNKLGDKPDDDKIGGYKSASIFGDKLTGAKLNDRLNKMDKLDKVN